MIVFLIFFIYAHHILTGDRKMQTSEVIEKLGGCRVVADLLNEKYRNVHSWNLKNKVPANKRIEFVKMANKNGLSVKVVDLV